MTLNLLDKLCLKTSYDCTPKTPKHVGEKLISSIGGDFRSEMKSEMKSEIIVILVINLLEKLMSKSSLTN